MVSETWLPGAIGVLIGVGRERDVAHDPVGVDVILARRLHVFELGRTKLGRKMLAATLGAVLQEAIAVHPDLRREGEVVHERAVLDDVGVGIAGGKSAMPDLRLPGERAGCPRGERRVEAVDSVPELLVVIDEPRAGELQVEELVVGVTAADVDVADRNATLVLKIVAPDADEAAHLRKDLHVHGDSGDRRHRQVLVLQILPLVVGLVFLEVVGGLILVEDLDVVIAVGAGRGHRDCRDGD